MGEILSDAVMQVMTPSLEYYDKEALAHVSKYADDYTGRLIDRHGNFRRGCIGLIHYIPEEAYERPWWREPQYPLKGCIERLMDSGWIKRVNGEELDGAMILNISCLVRLMDIAETEMAQNQHVIDYTYLPDGTVIDPPCEDFSDTLFLPFIRWADAPFPGDFAYTLADDVTDAALRLLDAHIKIERDHSGQETNPDRWADCVQ
ncbi:hypothetical protein [Corynebacterium argentoratense]|uniref:hypothetical protein n=1 Tax=Corynebacterium argentoratense TaxID=42817 RepID=UPI0040420F5D